MSRTSRLVISEALEALDLVGLDGLEALSNTDAPQLDETAGEAGNTSPSQHYQYVKDSAGKVIWDIVADGKDLKDRVDMI